MFNLSKALVEHAVKQLGLAAELASNVEANRDQIAKHIAAQIAEGKISFEDVLALSENKSVKSKGEQVLEDAFEKHFGKLSDAISKLVDAKAVSTPAVEAPAGTPAGEKAYQAAGSQPDAGADVRVKTVKDRFDTTKRFISAEGVTQTKSAALPSFAGAGSRQFDGFSELDRAVSGATLKYLYHRAGQAGQGLVPQSMKMTELDWDLMKYAAHEMEWVGPVGMRGSDDDDCDYGWAKGSRLSDIQTKAVLDGATSGGLEAVPIVFDDLAVITPLLTSELLPLVDMRVTSRRRVEGFKIANPEMYWTEEGTAPTEFATTDFITAFDTNIHPCVGWMEVGMDFISDSPVAIADLIISRYAQVARLKLENAIANGSGSGEPLGVLETVGATNVPATTATTGPWTVADYEALMFAIPKQFMQEAGNRMVFIGNQVTYRRARGIAVGASDQRRVFGMNERDWQLLGLDYKINHGLTNPTALCACMNRYVLYRRAGFEVRRVTEDADLAKKNMEMLVVRMRYGGQMNHASAVAKVVNGQT